ncbi:MAG: MerR family DNA-binding protein [Betaproteobacteria bacterium]|nr:MerR family DNA-binding protein [Betaproteobacteria bacterium]
MGALTIGTAARQAGVGVETIRFYERRGLIARPPKPPGAGFRRYAADTVHRIRFIRQAQQLGFSLRQIEELLSLEANPAADCSDVRRRALAKIEEVNTRINQLSEIRGALINLLAACPGSGALGACSILEALRVSESTSPDKPARLSRRPGRRGTMKTAIFRIEGMHCEGCVDTLKALLGAESGVYAAEVSLERGEARVLYDPKLADSQRLAATIEKSGYRVTGREP